MSSYKVQVNQVITAPAAQVYGILCDYDAGHKAILPKAYFEEMIVEQGGQGAGTIALVHMNVFGSKRSFRLETFEPEPGRVLEEVDEENGVTTRFIVEAIDEAQSLVTIASEVETRPGFRGWLERLMNPSITRRIYKAELQNLADYALTQM